ncbi:MAG: hypothetical protein KDD22_05160 [Bdellovibrionales bacterium]|nr:hypothetical protein [Bdellovibrionales bacterium]
MAKLKILPVLLALAWSSFVASKAHAGWHTGNAGDVFSAEFILTGRDVVKKLSFISKEQPQDLVDLARLSMAVETAIVHSEEEVFNNGHPVNAVNFYPEKNEIILSRSRWQELRRAHQTRERYLIVLHEYLWLTGIEDLQFQVSSKIIDWLNISNYNPNIFWNPVNPVNVLEVESLANSEKCKYEPQKFVVSTRAETQEMTPLAGCPNADIRNIKIEKIGLIVPQSEGVRGLFHRYQVTVTNADGAKLNQVTFEPEWGRCLGLDTQTCRYSGRLIFSDISLIFGFIDDFQSGKEN